MDPGSGKGKKEEEEEEMGAAASRPVEAMQAPEGYNPDVTVRVTTECVICMEKDVSIYFNVFFGGGGHNQGVMMLASVPAFQYFPLEGYQSHEEEKISVQLKSIYQPQLNVAFFGLMLEGL